jgi:hypothetical protein
MGLKPLAPLDRIEGMSDFAPESARRRRFAAGASKSAGRHARSSERDARRGGPGPDVGGGPGLDVGGGGSGLDVGGGPGPDVGGGGSGLDVGGGPGPDVGGGPRPDVGGGGSGPDVGGSPGPDARGELPRGRVMAGRPAAAWLRRDQRWSPAVGLFGRGIRVLAVRMAMVILFVALSVIAVPIAVTMLTSDVPPAPAGWTTAFSDNFAGPAGSAADSAWTYDTGDQYHGNGCQAQWATGEVDTDTNSVANVSEDGSGHLNITPVDLNGAWTSGRIETVSEFTPPAGGEMEVSGLIKQPDPSGGLGYWPSFWMLGANYRVSGAGTSGTMNCLSWPAMGEINIMEDVNAQSESSATLHCGTSPGGPCNENIGLSSGLQSCPGCQTGYNTYSVIINRTVPGDESITWYRDGAATHTVTESQVGTATWQAAVDHGFFIILNVALGGDYPNGACSCTTPSGQTTSGAAMSVGYVSVQTLAATGSATPGPSATPPPAPSPAASAPSSPSPAASAPSSPSPSPSASGSKICTQTATADISANCEQASSASVSVSPASGDTSPPGTDGDQIARLANGDWLEYPNVNFGSGPTQFDARVASGASPGVSGLVEVVLDRLSNAPVASFGVGSTGGWNSWRTIQANMAKVTGVHTVFLKFFSTAPGNPPLVSLHYFTFPVAWPGWRIRPVDPPAF